MNRQMLKEFQDRLADLGIAGNDLAVYVDAKEVYRHLSGWQDVEKGMPLTRKSLFRMFSMTKPVTCAAALKLYEEGHFLMNDPVSDYLPEFSDLCVAEQTTRGIEIRPAQKPLLIRHLFNMTSDIDCDMEHPAVKAAIEQYGDSLTTRQMPTMNRMSTFLQTPFAACTTVPEAESIVFRSFVC